MDGGLDVWDFCDQSHKPSQFYSVTSAPLSNLAFQSELPGNASATSKANADSQLAVGDCDGHLHVLTLPKSLVKGPAKEVEDMRRFLEREETSVAYFGSRKARLADLREELEKEENARLAAGVPEEGGETAEEKAEKARAKKIVESQDMYRKYENEMKMMLAEEAEAAEKAKNTQGAKKK